MPFQVKLPLYMSSLSIGYFLPISKISDFFKTLNLDRKKSIFKKCYRFYFYFKFAAYSKLFQKLLTQVFFSKRNQVFPFNKTFSYVFKKPYYFARILRQICYPRFTTPEVAYYGPGDTPRDILENPMGASLSPY